MVGMISAARQFEQQMKLLSTAEDDDKSAGQLLGVSG
jgi:flagellar basal-body rod protein FlgF